MGRFSAAWTLLLPVAAVAPALAEPAWMSEEAVRAELIGKSVTVEYHYGARWALTYGPQGRFDQSERRMKVSGRWLFQGAVFCSVPDHPDFRTGCWRILKASANCYEYFRVPTIGNEPAAGAAPEARWHVRSWKQGEASTCESTPVS